MSLDFAKCPRGGGKDCPQKRTPVLNQERDLQGTAHVHEENQKQR